MSSIKTTKKKRPIWLEKAALQDDDWAQVLLGDCYYLGRGVSKNHETAACWYEKAANLGNIDAQYMMGVCFYNGTGKPQSLPIAQSWFAKADAKNQYVFL